MKREKDFLDCFTEKYYEDLPSFCYRPFYKDGYVVATDSAILVRVPHNALKEKFCMPELKQRLPDFPKPNCDFELPLAKLVEILKSIPEEEQVPVHGTAAECDECGGSGTVEWVYEDSDGEEYREDFNCPICNGRGEVKTKKYLREWRCIRINDTIFLARTLMKLANAMDIAGFDVVKLRNLPNDYTPALMRLGDNVEVIIMPCTKESNPIREIKLKSSKKRPNYGRCCSLIS